MTFVSESRDYQASVQIMKTAGSGSPTTGTCWTLPSVQVACSNPTNISLPFLVNSDANVRNSVLGKKTPSVVITTVLKPSFCSAALFNSLLFSSDTNHDTDTFAIRITDGESNVRVFSLAKCAGISISCQAVGGAIGIQLSFISVYGDTEGPAVTGWTTPAVDPGALTPISQVDFNSTANAVMGFSLALNKTQTYNFQVDGTLYAQAVQSGPFSGSLSIAQKPAATVVPTTGCTIKLGSTGTGIQIASALVLGAMVRNYVPSLGTMANNYAIADLTTAGPGQPVVITSF